MQSFSIRAHRGGVRTVVADTDYVASGGDDKIIKIFNMGSREIVGDIRQHVGQYIVLFILWYSFMNVLFMPIKYKLV